MIGLSVTSPIVVKLAMTLLTNSEKVIDWLMKNSFVRQMSAFFSICTPANLTFAFGPHPDSARQIAPSW
jgi:hypothetical protein